GDRDGAEGGPAGAEMVRYGPRQQFARGRRGGHDRGLREVRRPMTVEGTIDHGAIAEPVGGDDDWAGDPKLLLQRRRHAASSLAMMRSASRQASERATTSPTTSSAGPSPACSASDGKSSRRPTAAFA